MKNYLTYINESIKYQFTIEQIQNKFQTFENNRYYGPVCAYLMDILKNNRVIIDVYRTTSKNCSLQQKYSIYVMDVIKPDNHNYTFIDENGYEYEPIYNRKISCYLDENEYNKRKEKCKAFYDKKEKEKERLRLKYRDVDPYGEEEWENENKIYESKDDFNVGDVVVCNGRMDDILFKGEIGIITCITLAVATVKFNVRFDDCLHDGSNNDDYTRSSYYIYLNRLKKASEDDIKKWKEEQERIKQKKEKMKLKHVIDDPYGEEEWIDEEFTSENKLYENFKPKYVNLNTIIADCKGDATLAEKNIKDLLLGETCIWYTKANVIKNMMVNSVEVNNVYQVYLNGHSVDKEMKVEIINLSKKDNDIYVVGFPSGEVIFLKKDQIEKLKNEKLIKYSNIVGVYGFMFYFNDTDYHKIKSYLDSNYKKPQKSQIIGLEPKLNYFIGDVIVCKGYSNMLDIDNKIATIRHKVKKSMGDSYSYLVEFNFKLHGDKGGSDGNFLWINIDNIKGIYKDIEKKIEDLEDHEIDDEYHIKNLFKKNDK